MEAGPQSACPPQAGECRWQTRSAAETRRLGWLLAACVRPGDLLGLRGELGAGKTTLVQGLAEGLEASEPATSPGFTLIHPHAARIPLYHLDLYRLGPGDLADIGVDEVLAEQAVVVVEWAERLPSALRGDGLDVDILFDVSDEDTRHFRLNARGPRGLRILAHLRAGKRRGPFAPAQGGPSPRSG